MDNCTKDKWWMRDSSLGLCDNLSKFLPANLVGTLLNILKKYISDDILNPRFLVNGSSTPPSDQCSRCKNISNEISNPQLLVNESGTPLSNWYFMCKNISDTISNPQPLVRESGIPLSDQCFRYKKYIRWGFNLSTFGKWVWYTTTKSIFKMKNLNFLK